MAHSSSHQKTTIYSIETWIPAIEKIPAYIRCMGGQNSPFKGTVSPDIGLYFRYLKIKSVLSAVPLIVFTLFYFVVPEIFQK
jgi:hypothetical protein